MAGEQLCMSQSQTASKTDGSHEPSSGDGHTVVAKRNIQDMFDAFDDADCRAILDVTSDEPLSAKEVADTFNLPLSTTYRKLGLLTDADLLEEQTRIRRSGKHINEYVRSVEHVVISLDSHGEMKLQVSQRKDMRQADSSDRAMGE